MNNLKLITKDQQLGFCLVSVAPIRKEPSDTSEIVSQLLFGEPLEILSHGEPWVKIRTTNDGYEGYVDLKHLLPLTEKELKKWIKAFRYQDEFLKEIRTPWGIQHTSRGSFIGDEQIFKIGSFEFSHELTHQSNSIKIEQTAIELLNVPYLWGGKSIYGIDCSGFIQLIFRLNNLNLPRDAYQQEEFGFSVDFQEATIGDVAFFSNALGKIIHVGLIIENNKIIHASGRVRVDELTETGIYAVDYQKETHKLHSIKRFI
jgi:hypothetical protein